MIKRFSLVLSLCLFLAACATSPETLPTPAPLSGIDAYREINAKFFHIDEQDFNAITCRIEVPRLTDIIQKALTQLNTGSHTATLVENMSEFSITYSPAQGISFVSPEVEVLISRVEGVEPPERFKEGARRFEEGIAIQVIAVQNQLSGLLDLMSAPQMGDYSDVSVVRTDGRSIFTYIREGIQVNETFFDNVREMRSEADNVRLFLRTEYMRVPDGRLAMSAAHIEAKQPVGDVTSDLEVELQQLGNILFLKRLGVDVTTRGQAIYHQASFDILLRDCRLH